MNYANYFAFTFMNGIALGFSFEKHPKEKRNDFVIYLPFMKLAWIKQEISDAEADDFINS